jgi:hypothetical protein
MRIMRFAAFCVLAAITPGVAQAQIFWQSVDFSGPPLSGYEAGMGVPLPGANAAEQNAAIIWNMRSALNVAALQCGFEPTLRTLENYNALISDHGAELTAAFNTLTAYFKRTNKTAAAGQKALDTFGTRTYSGWSTVRAQLAFCTISGRVGRTALFTPRGQFLAFAKDNLRQMRNGLVPSGDQQFRFPRPSVFVRYPNLEERCWKGKSYTRKCGLLTSWQ